MPRAATQSVSELNRREDSEAGESGRGSRRAPASQLAVTGVTRLLPLE